jgi:hypothetical protein
MRNGSLYVPTVTSTPSELVRVIWGVAIVKVVMWSGGGFSDVWSES